MRAPNQGAQGSAHPSNANTSPRMSCGTRLKLPGHGVDRAGIALWLENESVETTQMYLHADLALKEEALAKTTPLDFRASRYRPDDSLLAFLKGL